MKAEILELKYIQIAELFRNIEKVNEIIEMHKKQTNDNSMVRQYMCQRAEFIEELQGILKSLDLELVSSMAA